MKFPDFILDPLAWASKVEDAINDLLENQRKMQQQLDNIEKRCNSNDEWIRTGGKELVKINEWMKAVREGRDPSSVALKKQPCSNCGELVFREENHRDEQGWLCKPNEFCGSRNGDWVCNLPKGHPGAHKMIGPGRGLIGWRNKEDK